MVKQIIDFETGEVLNTKTWDILCEQGRIAAIHIDEGRWSLGELALMVGKSYGDDALGEFAREVNVPKKRMTQYRTVCNFWCPAWEKSTRVDFLEERETITYTHMRDAMRFKDLKRALAWLGEVAANGWTTDQAAFVLSERLGVVKSEPAPKLLDTTVHFCKKLTSTQIVIELHPEAAALLIGTRGAPLRMVVWEAEG